MGHIKLQTLLKEILLNEVSIEQLKQQFVDTGKLTQEVFDQIVDATNSKSAYTTWMCKQVYEEIIKEEDIYKYEEYFRVFEKYKRAYPKQDINQYKTFRDVDTFNAKSIEVIDMLGKNQKPEGEDGEDVEDNSKNLLTPTQIKSLTEVGIKYLGTVEGYQSFEIPSSLAGDNEAFKRYKNLIGQCSGGAIQICTIANMEYFTKYLKDGNLYVFFNLGDPQSPYQFHYESSQFMDRSDRSVI